VVFTLKRVFDDCGDLRPIAPGQAGTNLPVADAATWKIRFDLPHDRTDSCVIGFYTRTAPVTLRISVNDDEFDVAPYDVGGAD
jgi:hypothetical protein